MVTLSSTLKLSYVLKSDIKKSPASFTLPAGVVVVFFFVEGKAGRWIFPAISDLQGRY